MNAMAGVVANRQWLKSVLIMGALAVALAGCPKGEGDGGTDSTPGVDSNVPGVDSNVPGVDSNVPGVDSSVPGTDGGVPGVEICDNSMDDDGDGIVDCADMDCLGHPSCASEICLDFVDNDGDGDVDCVDADCAADPSCTNAEDCTNGVDDNGDGNVDCDDFFCLGVHPACGEVCGDGLDNDGDGDIDCNDTDCSGIGVCGGPGGAICAYQGATPHPCECNDGIDNDGDGNTDGADIHCFGPLDDDESAYATGIPGDNNGNNGSFECPFDGNSGPGNDLAACCNPDPTMNATPNGCDHQGCCEIDVNGNGTGEFVRIGGACDFAPACGMNGMEGCPCTVVGDCDAGQFCVMDDDTGAGFCSTCEACVPDSACLNGCACFEICFAGFSQPNCVPNGTDAGVPGMDSSVPGVDSAVPPGTDSGSPPVCPGGGAMCTGIGDCPGINEGCQGGCCVPQCPATVTACGDTNDCPNPIEICVTGCCITIG